MANKNVSFWQSKKTVSGRATATKESGPKIGQVEALESRQLLSAFHPVGTNFQWAGRGRSATTEVRFDDIGNFLGASGPEASRHPGGLLGGGSKDPNRIVVNFSGAINTKTIGAGDITITGDFDPADPFRPITVRGTRKTLTIYTTGRFSAEPDSDITLQIRDIQGKRPVAVLMDPWSITLDITANSCSTNCGSSEPPTVLEITPALGATLNQSPTFVEARFSEDLEATSVSSSTFRLIGSGGDGIFDNGNDISVTPTGISYNAGTDRARFSFTGPLANDTYRVRLLGTGASPIRDLQGNALGGGADFTSTFVVDVAPVDTTPPRVQTITPNLNTVFTVAPPTVVEVQFSERVLASSVTLANFTLVRSGGDNGFTHGNEVAIPAASLDYDSTNHRARFVISGTLPNDLYLVRLRSPGGIQDLAGNALDGDPSRAGIEDYTSVFRVNVPPPPDIQPPTVTSITPGQKVLASSPAEIVVTFSEPMDANTIVANHFSLRARGPDATFSRQIPVSVSFNAATNTARVVPGQTLSDDIYLLRIDANGVRDVAGNKLDGDRNGTGGDNFASTFAVSILAGLQGGDPPDPFADTGSADGFGRVSAAGTVHDIESVGVVSDARNAYFRATFFGTIQPASRGLGNSLFGFFDIDSDQNVQTGRPSTASGLDTDTNGISDFGSQQDVFGQQQPGTERPHLLGDEFYISLGSEAAHPGLVDIFGTTTGTWLLDLDGGRSVTIGEVPFLFQPIGCSMQKSCIEASPSGAVVGQRVFLGDWNGDGRKELGSLHVSTEISRSHRIYVDRDGNRRFDPNEDLDADGVLDVQEIDRNANGIPDSGEDIDGDGKFDQAEDRDGDGFLDNDGPFTLGDPVGFPSPVVMTGDIDGDGTDNIVLFDAAVGRFLVDDGDFRDSAGDRIVNASPGDIPFVADFDGDGRAEVAVYRFSGGIGSFIIDVDHTFDLTDGGNAVITTSMFAIPNFDATDIPVVGDWDGFFEVDFNNDGVVQPGEDINGNGLIDGKTADIGFFRPTTGELFLNRNAGTSGGFYIRTGPGPNDKALNPSSQAFDPNDGPLSFGVSIGADGELHQGLPDWMFLGQQDFNGDGRDEIGFFRRSTNDFFLDLSGDGTHQSATEGPFRMGAAPAASLPADVPLTGDLDGDGDSDIGVFRTRGDVSVGLAPIFFRDKSVTVKVPLGLIGETPDDSGAAADFLNFGLVVGTGPIFAAMTDEAPNIGAAPPFGPPPAASGPLTPVTIVGVETDVTPGGLPAGMPPRFSAAPPGGIGSGYPTRITVNLSGDIDPTTVDATTLQTFRTGGDGVFGNGNDLRLFPTSVQVTTQDAANPTGTDRINIFLPTAPEVPGDDYQIILRGNDPIRDRNGVPIDGDFPKFAAGTLVFPSGNGSAEGDFILPIRIDRPPVVNFVRLTLSSDAGVPEVSDTGRLDDGLTKDATPTFLGMVSDDRLRPAVDPSGDTFGTGTNQPDLTGVSAEFSTSDQEAVTGTPPTLFVALQFLNPISLASSGPLGLNGFVDLDTDQDPSTGGVAWYADRNGDRVFRAPAEGPLRFGAQSGDPSRPVSPVHGNWFVAPGLDRTDFGVYNPVTGVWHRDLNGNGILEAAESSTFTGVPDRIALVGNFDGIAANGDERGEYDPTTGTFFLEIGGAAVTVPWIAPPTSVPQGQQDVPIVGDWNGDGQDDIGLYRPSGIFPLVGAPLFSGVGLFFIDADGDRVFDPSEDTNGDGGFTPGAPPSGEDANANGVLDLNDGPLPFGLIGSSPVIGDWGGTGADRIGAYNRLTSAFTLDLNGNKVPGAGEGPFVYGVAGDLPVSGDWNGDGTDQIGVFRPSGRQFVLDLDNNRSAGIGEAGVFLGSAGTTPIVGNFNGDSAGTIEVGTFSAQDASTQTGLGRGPVSGLGSEFVIDLGSERLHAGFVDVIDAETGAVIDLDPATPGTQRAPITLFPDNRGALVRIPLSAIGESGDGNLNFGAVVGLQDQVTDEAPNTPLAVSSQSLLVELDSNGDGVFDNGNGVTMGFGKFVVTVSDSSALADGVYDGSPGRPQLDFRVTDEAGNLANRRRSVAVDSQPPQIVAYGAFVPVEDSNRNGLVDPGEGGVINPDVVASFDLPPSFFQVTFSELMELGAVSNLSNYMLTTADGQDRSTFLAGVAYNPGPASIPDLADEDLDNDGVLDVGEDRNANGLLDQFPSIPARTARIYTAPGMPSGSYVFTVKDTITDLAGNLLDGENPGEPIFPPPTGDGEEGGAFQTSFALDQGPPRVLGIEAITSSGPDGVAGTPDDLGPDGLIGTADDYGPDATPGTADDAAVPFLRAFFDPTGVEASRAFIGVRVTFSQPIDRSSVTAQKVLLVRSGGDGDFQNGGIPIAPAPGWPLAGDFSNDDTTLLFRIHPSQLPLASDYYRFTLIGGGNLPVPNPVQANIDVSVQNPAPTPPGGTPINDYQGEPAIDLNPSNPDNLLAASNNKSTDVVTAYLSLDGGLTWDDRPLTNTVGGVTYSESVHPSVAFDANNRAYIAYLARNPGVDSAIVVARSPDGGNSFNLFNPVATANAQNAVDDFPWIAADDQVQVRDANQNLVSNPFANNVYVAWTRTNFLGAGQFDQQEVLFMRSTNNGAAFQGETLDACPPNGSLSAQLRINDAPGVNSASRGVGNVHLAVGPERALSGGSTIAPGGVVYGVWEDWGGPTVPTSSPVQIRFDRSFDGGQTFCGSDGLGADIIVGTSLVNGFSDQGLNRYAIPAQPDRGIAANPVIDVDRTSDGPFRGRIYLAYADRSATASRIDTDIFIRFSDDQGLTWSAPQQVNDPASDGQFGNASQFNPSLRVDPITGRVIVTWYDTRNDVSNRSTRVFTSVVTPGQVSLNIGLNFLVTPVSSDESLFGPQPNDPDDYGNNADVVIHDGIAHAVWTDTRLKDGDTIPAEEVFTARVNTNLLFGPSAVVTGIRDRVGNQLDGEAIGVNGDGIGLPSGDGIEGGTFVAGAFVAQQILNVDSSYEEDPFVPSDGSSDNPYPTIERALAASTGFAAGGPTLVRVRNGGGTPYIIEPGPGQLDASIRVPDFTVLTLDAGTTVKLRSSNIDVNGAGAVFQALGTQLSPVRLTSTINDDARVGGDTNRDGSNTTPRGGDWGGVVFRSRIDNVLSIVDHAVIDFGGGPVPNAIGPRFDSIYLESTAARPVSPALTNLVMTNNGVPGSADNMQFPISANIESFIDSTVAAADGTADGTVGPLIRNATLRDNSVNALWIRPSPSTGQAVVPAGAIAKWDDPIVHVLNSLVRIVGSGQRQPTTLTINPGMVVKGINAAIATEGTARLNVGSSATGDSRVVLTSIFDDTAGFQDAGFDTNNDGIAGVDTGAILPLPGDWAGLDFRSSISSQAFGLIDETDIRYGGGAYPLGVTVPSIGLAGPGYYQITRNNIQFDGSAAPIQVAANVLRADVPFDVRATPLVDEGVLDENPLLRGNRMTNNNLNGMLILPIVIPGEFGPGPATLLNTSFFDVNDNGILESTDGIDILWDDTDMTHVVTSTLALPGKVFVPDPFLFRSKLLFENLVRTADITGNVRRIDFETNPATGQAFRPNAGQGFVGLSTGPGYPSVKHWQGGQFGVTFSSIARAGTAICQEADINDPACAPAGLVVDGFAVPAGTQLGDPLPGDPTITPTSGIAPGALPPSGPNLPGDRVTASALTTDPRDLRSDGSIQIDFAQPVFAVGFHVIGSSATDAAELVEIVIRDSSGTLRTVPAAATPFNLQAVATSTFTGQPDIASDNFFVGAISPFPIVRVVIRENTGLEPVGTTNIPDRIGIDDMVFSTIPIPPIVPVAIQPSAAHVVRSAAPGEQLRTFEGTVFETLNQGESLVVKLFGADPSGANGLPGGPNRANWGAGIGGGLDDGIDDCTAQSSCITDWGGSSAVRIIGVPGIEATGQPPVPVVMTSLRDDTVGPLGIPQDTNNDGTSTSPAPGDWGAIVLGGRLTNDRDDLFTAGPDGIAGLDPGPDGRCGTPDDVDGRLDNVPHRSLFPVPGVFGTFVTRPDGCLVALPADLDKSMGSHITNGVFKFGSKIRLQSASQVPPFGQEEFLRSAVIANNQIFNFSEFGVLAQFGIHRDPTAVPPGPCGPGGSPPCVEPFAIEPAIYNNVIANVAAINPGQTSLPFVGIRIDEDPFNPPGDLRCAPSHAVVLHNTLFGLSTGIDFAAFGPLCPFTRLTGTQMALNNLIASTTTPFTRVTGLVGFNLFFNSPVQGANPINGNLRWSDPSLFVDVNALDFRLRPFSSTGQPNPAIDAALSEFTPVSGVSDCASPLNFDDCWASDTLDDIIVRLPDASSPVGPEKDLFGSLRLDDIRVSNLGNGAKPFFDIGAVESRDFGSPVVTNLELVTGSTRLTVQPSPPTGVGAVLQNAPDQIVATFSEDLDVRTLTGRSFRITASGGDGTFFDGNERPIAAASIVFDAALNTATFVAATPLLEDRYRVELIGTGSAAITDVQGIRLDGEFRAYPSGDGFPGGDFVAFFAVQIPPRVTSVVAKTATATSSLDSTFPPGPAFVLATPPSSVEATFTEVVTIPVGAFRVAAAGPDLTFGSADDIAILGTTTFNALTRTATFVPNNLAALPTNTFYQVVLDGTGNNAITDVSGIPLDGENNEPVTSISGDGNPGGDWIGYLRVGSVVPTSEQTIFVDVSNTSGIENGSQRFPYNTIQEGLDATDDVRKVVVVLPGTYFENVRFNSLRHNGVTLTSQEGDATTRIVVAFNEDTDCDGIRDANEPDVNNNGELDRACNPGGPLNNNAPTPVDPTKPAVDIDLALNVIVEGFQITTTGLPLVTPAGESRPSGGVGVRVNASNVAIRRNTIFDNRTGVLVDLGVPGSNPRIENNVIWANNGPGVEVRGRVNVPAEIVNNTVVFNVDGIRLVATAPGAPRIANVYNNIIVGSTGAGIRSVNTAGATIDFNDVFQNLGGNYVNVQQIGTHNISFDPLFLVPVQRPSTGRPDPSLANWRLGAFSPAIDSALGDEDLNGNGILDFGEDANGNSRLDAPPVRDHDGRNRFDDLNVVDDGLGLPTFVDMGAFERLTSSSGAPGSGIVASSTQVRATDEALSSGDFAMATAGLESTRADDKDEWREAMDDMLENWTRRLRDRQGRKR